MASILIKKFSLQRVFSFELATQPTNQDTETHPDGLIEASNKSSIFICL